MKTWEDNVTFNSMMEEQQNTRAVGRSASDNSYIASLSHHLKRLMDDAGCRLNLLPIPNIH